MNNLILFDIIFIFFHQFQCIGTLDWIRSEGHTGVVRYLIKWVGMEWEFSDRHSTRWLFLSTVSRSNWNLECWFFWREENWRIQRKILGTGTRTSNKLNPQLAIDGTWFIFLSTAILWYHVWNSFDRCLQTDSWRIVSAGDDKTLKVTLWF